MDSSAPEKTGLAPVVPVRFSPGPFTTEEEIDAAIRAMTEIARVRS